MGHNSQSGQLGLGFQGGKGSAAVATRFMRVKGGGMGADRSLMIPDAEIGGNRDTAQAYLGPVAFSGDYEAYLRMEMLAFCLKAVLGSASSTNVAGTSEVQTITITGTPTGGTFTLSYRGQTTSALAYNAAAAAIQSALVGLTTIGAGNVTCAGGPLPGTPVTVTFGGTLAASDPPMLVATSSLTGGTAPAIAVTASTPGKPPVGTHVITGADTIPWMTAEERIGASFESMQYVDCKMNSFKMSAEANGYLTGGFSLMGLSGASGFTAQVAPNIDITPMIVGSQISLTFGGAALTVKSMDLEINNNVEGDDFVLGSIYGNDMTEKRREIKLSVTRRPQDSTLWKAAMWGATGRTTAQAGPAYQGALQLVMSSYEKIDGVTPYSCTIDIPVGAIAPFKVSPSGDDILEETIEITLLRPDPLVPTATFTVKNDLATVV